jgi:probable phosphoglycerate mutase
LPTKTSPFSPSRRQKADYTLVFDGGSRGNPGTTYGSFRLQRSGQRPSAARRLAFGRGTNNEAEYQALIAGIQSLLDSLPAAHLDPRTVRLEVRGDSLLVLRQLDGSWKAREPRMRVLRDEARRLLDRFASVRLTHQDRGRSLAVLGH